MSKTNIKTVAAPAAAPKAPNKAVAAPKAPNKAVAAPAAEPAEPTAPKVRAKDAITDIAAYGGPIVFVMAGDQKLAMPAAKFTGDILKLAVVGASMASLRTALGQPKPTMANGTNGRVAPHSAKAVADAKSKDAPAPKAVAPKAVAPKAPKAGATYKVGPLANDARVGTWRHYMVAIVQAHTDRASADAAHANGKFPGFSVDFAGKKLDFGWMAKTGYTA